MSRPECGQPAGPSARRPGRGRTGARLLATLVVLLIGATPLGTASATPLGTASAAQQAAAPAHASTLAFAISSITPSVVTAETGSVVAIRGRVTNTTDSVVTNLTYRVQRGRSLTTRSAVETQIVQPAEVQDVVTNWQDFGGTFTMRGGRDFELGALVSGDGPDSLRIDRPGIFPISVLVNGTVDIDGVPTDTRVGTLQFLLTVTSTPDISADQVIKAQVPTMWLWKLSSTPHRGVDGVFLDDSLAADITTGPLAQRLDALQAADMPAGALTLAIDPMLLAELAAMSQGYWVQQPGVAQGAITTLVTPPTTAPTAAPDASAPDSSSGDTTISPPSSSDSAAMTSGAVIGTTSENSDAPTDATTPGSAAAEGSQSLPPNNSGTDSSTTTDPATTDPTATEIAQSGSGSAVSGSAVGGSAVSGSAVSGTASEPESHTSTPVTSPPVTSTAVTSPAVTSPASEQTVPDQTVPDQTVPDQPAPPNTVRGVGQVAAQEFLNQLREVARTTPILVLPYSDPDVVALARTGHQSLLEHLVTRGREVAEAVFTGSQTTPLITDVALPPDGIADTVAATAYSTLGYRSIIVANDSARSADRKPSDSLAVATIDGGTLPTLLDDSPIQGLLNPALRPGTSTSAADAVSDVTAMIFRRAIDGDARPLVRLPDRIIDTGGLADLADAWRTLQDQGVIEPVNPRQLTDLIIAGTVPTDPTVGAKTPTPGVPRVVTATLPDGATAGLLSADYLGNIDRRMATIAALRGTFDVDTIAAREGIATATPGESTPINALLTVLTDALAPLASVSLRPNDSRANAMAIFQSVDDTRTFLRAGVSLVSSVGSYTLAGSDSPLYLTVQNTLPYPVLVTARIDGGESVGLTPDVPALVLLPAQSSRQIAIPTTVSRSGSFQVRAQLLDPDGQNWGTPQTLSIRSNAFGTLTIILITVAGVVLLLMVGWRVWQRWKERQRRLAGDIPSPAASPNPGLDPDDILPADPGTTRTDPPRQEDT